MAEIHNQDMDIQQKSRVIVAKLRKSDVFSAVGSNLQRAMIAAEVMHIMRMQATEYQSSVNDFIAIYELSRDKLLGVGI